MVFKDEVGYFQKFYLPSPSNYQGLEKIMQVTGLPFRLGSEALSAQLGQFHARQEIQCRDFGAVGRVLGFG
jgi:hypothetical protein